MCTRIEKPTCGFTGHEGYLHLAMAAFALLLTGAPLRAQTQELILPVAVNGIVNKPVHYQSTFTLVNLSQSSVQVTLQVYDNRGKPGGVFCSPLAPPPSMVKPILDPAGAYQVSTSADATLTDGWARLTWEGPSTVLATAEVDYIIVAPEPCLLICNRPSTDILTSAQVPAVKPGREFRAPVTITKNRHTGFALVNPSSTATAHVSFRLIDSRGMPSTGGDVTIDIEPLQRVSAFAWKLEVWCPLCARPVDPPAPEMFHGSARITSDSPIAVGALDVILPEGKFLNVPVASAETAPLASPIGAGSGLLARFLADHR